MILCQLSTSKRNAFVSVRSTVQKRLREMQDAWQSDVLRRASIPSIHTLLQQAQLRWAWHDIVVRMSDSRLLWTAIVRLLHGELSQGKRSARGQKKRYKDSLKVSVKSFGICDSTWESPAKISLHGVQELQMEHVMQDRRLNEAEMKRTARKDRDDSYHRLWTHMPDLRERLSCLYRSTQPYALTCQHYWLVVVIFDFEGRTPSQVWFKHIGKWQNYAI